MADRPILFSGPMVRAILAGKKTQTRRLATNTNARRIQRGDRLWVRETWSLGSWEDAWRYKATGDFPLGGVWKPSIHMPRAASRITLDVLLTTRYRLQLTSHAEARAEGCSGLPEFSELWDKINDRDGCRWEDNPTIIAILFKVVQP